MMSSYVCRQCRTRLTNRLSRPRYPHSYPRATFISLRNEESPASQQQSTNAEQDPNKQKGVGNGGDGQLDTHITGSQSRGVGRGRTQQIASGGRYSKYTANAAKETPVLDVAGKARHQDNVRKLESGSNSHALQIDHSLSQRDFHKAWDQFLDAYPSKDCPALSNPSYTDLSLIASNTVFDKLLMGIVGAFCHGQTTPNTPSGILHKFEQLGIQRPHNWRNAIRKLTDEVVTAYASERENRKEIFIELLSVWRLFFQCKGKVDLPIENLDLEWKSISGLENVKDLLLDPSTPRDFNQRFQLFHPRSVGNIVFGFSALTIFSLLKDKSGSVSVLPEDLANRHAPFLELITNLLPYSSTHSVLYHAEVSSDFKAVPEKYRTELINKIKSAPTHAMVLLGERGSGHTQTPMTEAELASTKENFLLKRIDRAIYEKSHQEKVQRLWNETLRVYTAEDKTVKIPLTIYNSFLSGFLSLFAANETVEVWNHMIAHGRKPDVTTWTAMLTGCVKARDLNGLNAMWSRMIQSGVQPDNHAWTTRVYGLISLREINAGFIALDDMGKRWLAAERDLQTPQKEKKHSPSSKKINPNTKPSIEVINGAISALSNLSPKKLSFERKCDFIHKVLAWARSFDIDPSARTYNTLIKVYLGGHDYQTTFGLLRQMESKGIEGDMATYTMLVRASFNDANFSSLSPANQVTHIKTLFEQLESSGLKLNSYIYATAIDTMLKQYKNLPAVRSVIDHMVSRNMTPSAHIYTSLFTHYFQSDPPDIAAADSLWLQIIHSPGSNTDKILFDRIIEGYAAAGHIGRMMTVLTQMSKHGNFPGWDALIAVVRALVKEGEWERARNVVRDVNNGEGVAKGVITGGMHGQKNFFYVVIKELGLMADESGQAVEGTGTPKTTRSEKLPLRNKETHEPPVPHSFGSVVQKEGWAELSKHRAEPQEDWRKEDNGSIGGIPL